MLSKWKDGVKGKRWTADTVSDWKCRKPALFAKYAKKGGTPFFFEVELDLNCLIPSYLRLILASWLGYPRIVLAPASQAAIVFLK